MKQQQNKQIQFNELIHHRREFHRELRRILIVFS